jgi:hypothetical protein
MSIKDLQFGFRTGNLQFLARVVSSFFFFFFLKLKGNPSIHSYIQYIGAALDHRRQPTLEMEGRKRMKMKYTYNSTGNNDIPSHD